MDRRTFLGGLAVLGCQGALMNKASAAVLAEMPFPKQKKVKGEFDDNQVVIISDLHTNPDGYQPDKLRRVINDIVTMKPKPRNVIALGDLAYLRGKEKEYELLREIIAPLENAGIQLTMAMGNHDRRDNFTKYFPGYAAKSLLKDRLVFRVETPRAVFIVLDSMQKGDTQEDFIVEGNIDDNQREWLKNQLTKETKPAFVMAHHPLLETRIESSLVSSPTCSGYIYGHDHRWRKDWFHIGYSERTLIRTLCMPSTGHWGDIGYTLMTLNETYAVVELKQHEFFFPTPAAEGEEKPMDWKMIEEEHAHEKCQFLYRT